MNLVVRLRPLKMIQYQMCTGHGKLTLGDSGYYEGSFQHGEIEGHGYKVFGISGASYTGQFHLGEMHGQGLMRHPNGEQYEGSWYQGKKQGTNDFVSRHIFHYKSLS